MTKSSPVAKPLQSKLKVLCLHGYRQSERSFREKLGAFRKIVNKSVDFVFMTAPHKITSVDNEDEFGWWFSSADSSYNAHQASECDKGFQESLDFVCQTLKKGHFDGILAFSQGASLATILCLRKSELDLNFNFAILIAPFKSRIAQHSSWFERDKIESIQIPSLLVIGKEDKVIEKEMSDEVVKYFQNPKILYHPGGHYVPAKSADKKVYQDFLQQLPHT